MRRGAAVAGAPLRGDNGRGAALRPVLGFLGVLVVFFAISYTQWYEGTVVPRSLELNASVSALLLRQLGEDAMADGPVVRSSHYSLIIGRGCDALKPYLLFAAAVLASPVAARLRLAGLMGGAVVLLTLNQLRIASLFFAGMHLPAAFEFLHVDVWQPLFIVVALGTWLLWATHASGVTQR